MNKTIIAVYNNKKKRLKKKKQRITIKMFSNISLKSSYNGHFNIAWASSFEVNFQIFLFRFLMMPLHIQLSLAANCISNYNIILTECSWHNIINYWGNINIVCNVTQRFNDVIRKCFPYIKIPCTCGFYSGYICPTENLTV